MKQLAPLLAVLAVACGDNIADPNQPESEPLVFECDGSQACDDAVDSSLDAWLENGSDRAGSYVYAVRFESESGYRITTEVRVESGSPVARSATGLRPDEATGTLEPFEWSESGDSLGIHSEGAPAAPVSSLYETCILEVLAANRVANDVRVELFPSGALKACTFTAKDCAGDCTFGPELATLELAPE